MRARADDTITIGELSRRAQVSPRTVRYYEEIGILPPPDRSVGGTRRYPSDYVVYLRGALMLKRIGFSLEEIAALGRGPAASERTAALVRDRLADLEHRIRVLHRLHDLVTGASNGAPALLRWLSENGHE